VVTQKQKGEMKMETVANTLQRYYAMQSLIEKNSDGEYWENPMWKELDVTVKQIQIGLGTNYLKSDDLIECDSEAFLQKMESISN
jgi:hypothetical protein